MHVAFCSPSWALRTHPNGINTYVHWMRQELLRQGHQVSVFTSPTDTADANVHSIVPSRTFNWLSALRAKLPGAKSDMFVWGDVIADAMQPVHRGQPIDVIEMEESFGWFANVARRLRVPTVVKLHGPAFMSLVEEELHTPLADAKIEVEGRALRALPVITSPSQRTLDATIARYDLKPRLSRHIVNPLALPANAPVWDLARCERETLLFVGRFDQRKGGDVVLEALAHLLARRPTLKLIFVGPDAGIPDANGRRVPFDEMKRALFPGAAADRVDFRGRLAADEIYGLRAQAFATIVASRWENQSYTLLEAMLQGCPIVSSDTGGQGEAVRHGATGLLTRVGDARDLADKLEQLLQDPAAAARLGRAARDYALTQHSPEAVAAQTLDVYRQAIALAGMRAATPSGPAR